MAAYRVDTYPFRFDRRYQLAALPFGIAPQTAGVQLTGGDVAVRFGPWRLRTSRSNIASVSITGPYRLVKTIGPPHLSWTDQGMSCVTNPEEGVCIAFKDPVAGIEPLGVLRHPAVTVTVAECSRLTEALA